MKMLKGLKLNSITSYYLRTHLLHIKNVDIGKEGRVTKVEGI